MSDKYNDILENLRKKGTLIEGWMEHLPEILHRYIDMDERLVDLGEEFGVPENTLRWWLKKLKISKPDLQKSAAEEVVKKAEVRALAEEAEKLSTVALAIGGVVARRYQPLIDHEMAKGKSLEVIAEDIMTWYEEKTTTKQQIDALETENAVLRDQAAEAWGLAAPNFRYMLRTKLLDDHTIRLLRLKTLGVKIDIPEAIRGFQADLKALDDDFGRLLEVKMAHE